MQTDAKTFADMFPYPICNLCAVSLLYFAIYQRFIKFMTSTSLSAEKEAVRLPFFVCGGDENPMRGFVIDEVACQSKNPSLSAE